MLGRVLNDEADRYLWKKTLDVAEQIICPGFKYQSVMARQKNVTDRKKVVDAAVNIGDPVGYVLPAGRMCFAFEYDRYARSGFACRCI